MQDLPYVEYPRSRRNVRPFTHIVDIVSRPNDVYVVGEAESIDNDVCELLSGSVQFTRTDEEMDRPSVTSYQSMNYGPLNEVQSRCLD